MQIKFKGFPHANKGFPRADKRFPHADKVNVFLMYIKLKCFPYANKIKRLSSSDKIQRFSSRS